MPISDRLKRFVLCVAALGAAIALAACGVANDEALLSSIEGRWMCDVQRYTFEETSGLHAELESRLAGNGVSAEQYRAFKDDLSRHQELRSQVAVAYDAYCDTGS